MLNPCDWARQMGACTRCIFGLLCCVMFIGPILIIVGIVLFTVKDDRQKRVDQYNTAVRDYNQLDAPVLSQTTMLAASNNVSYVLSRSYTMNPIVPIRNIDPIRHANHYTFLRAGIPRATLDTYALSVSLSNNTGTVPTVLNFQIEGRPSMSQRMSCEGAARAFAPASTGAPGQTRRTAVAAMAGHAAPACSPATCRRRAWSCSSTTASCQSRR
jgi:hypothetical protein